MNSIQIITGRAKLNLILLVGILIVSGCGKSDVPNTTASSLESERLLFSPPHTPDISGAWTDNFRGQKHATTVRQSGQIFLLSVAGQNFVGKFTSNTTLVLNCGESYWRGTMTSRREISWVGMASFLGFEIPTGQTFVLSR